MFDLTDKATFDNLQSWREQVTANCPDPPHIVLIGTKADLVDKRRVTVEEAKEFADHHQISYFETSAKTNKNISEAVLYLLHEIIEMYVAFDDIIIDFE